ncbi:MAG: hypothetical protein EZS28_010154 [Streblomastix strix]|uniref:Uncharacterized protein n=1 Tax=Streblomastix strix TaxID=222440 RepID=A0A5J4WHM3_9EUKA|nr:MAG: hypothetical protein EZS28_010154 [Streblomastix strix]
MKNRAVLKGGWTCKVKINITIKGNLEAILQMIKVNQSKCQLEQTADIVTTTDASEIAWEPNWRHQNRN